MNLSISLSSYRTGFWRLLSKGRKMPRLWPLTVVLLLSAFGLKAQDTDRLKEQVDRFYATALADGKAYENLEHLVTRFPGRLTGSKNLEGAISWSAEVLASLKPDRLELQESTVPHWVRGAPESVEVETPERVPLTAVALGFSAATPEGGVSGEVIEVTSLPELSAMPDEAVRGKIVFFNRPMNPATHPPGRAYGEAGDQRNAGPALASRKGAVAALVRSLTQATDDVPHTGYTGFPPGTKPIPALALSTRAANRLHDLRKADANASVRVRTHCETLPDVVSHNVIAEIRGSEQPEQILLVGGHIDSWDIAPGAHDDGAGVCQAIEVLRLFRVLGIQPKHTLRVVLFVGEENSLAGALSYNDRVARLKERHLLALESDSGGFSPQLVQLGHMAFEPHAKAARWLPYFAPYGVVAIEKGGGGADVGPLLKQGSVVGEIVTHSQRYFDLHHTRRDDLDQVNPRELHLGAATLASLIWLVDTEGF